MSTRTDLAIELNSRIKSKIKGVKNEEKNFGEITLSKTEILSLEGEEKIGKPMGKYITVQFPEILKIADFLPLKKALRESLSSLLKDKENILVVGLGNREITADAVGPLTASRLLATRHIMGNFAENIGLSGLKSVAVLSPDVLGKTGIEAYEIVEAAAKKIKPSAIIAIDALAAGEVHRLFRTVQLCNSGISPGSGVKNSRKELSESSLGIPVIGIGVPTVVDAGTLAFSLTRKEPEGGLDMIVTPKDCDILCHKISEILASVLNEFLQPNIDREILEALV